MITLLPYSLIVNRSNLDCQKGKKRSSRAPFVSGNASGAFKTQKDIYLNSGVPYIQSQTRKHLEATERKRKFVGPLFANGSAAQAKQAVAANYTLYSADAAVLEAERAFIKSRSEANLASFKKRERRAFAKRKVKQEEKDVQLLRDQKLQALLVELEEQEREQEQREEDPFFAFTL